MNLFDVKNLNILVIGGASQILSEFVRHIIKAGANVALTSRELSKFEPLSEVASGGELILRQVDPLDLQQLRLLSEEISSKWERIDALICAAGAGTRGGDLNPDQPLSDLDLAGWKESFDLNFFSAVAAAKLFAAPMIDSPHASVAICVGSVSVQSVLSKSGAYGASKSALEKCWKEFGQYAAERRQRLQIATPMCWRILQPGFFPAEQNRRFLLNPDGTPTARGMQMLERTPLRRFGSAKDLVRPLVSMLFPEFQTMDVVSVGGGYDSDLPY